MLYQRKTSHLNHLSRYREVANCLIKHGFGFLFEQANFRFIPRLKKKNDQDEVPESLSRPQHLRMALEELGPAYIKLGQLLSIRPDLLPPQYIKELEKLQNDVPPVSFLSLSQVCERNHIHLETDFKWVNPEPIAAASIAQVHEAILMNGKRVVIKIQRPGIAPVIETDLQILMNFSLLLERRTSWGSFYRISQIVEELAGAIRKELDFEQEGRNADLFHKNFSKNKDIVVPVIYWQYSCKQVLTMEYLEGIKISDFSGMRQAKMNTTKIADKLVRILFEQIYEHGFFHADPHPGNIALNSSQQLIFYDFGQVGAIDNALKERCMDLLISMMRYDVNGVTRALLSIGISESPVNQANLRKDVARLEQKYYGLPMAQIKLGEALAELLELTSRYRVRIPAELSLLVKMLMTIEGIVTQLDPQISLVDIAVPYGRHVLMKRYSPSRVGHDVTDLALDYLRVFRSFPREMEEILQLMSNGEMKIKLEHTNLNRITSKFDIMSNRLSLAIILASIIIGTALIADKTNSTVIRQIPMVDIGFIIAVILGLFMAYSILKSGKY